MLLSKLVVAHFCGPGPPTAVFDNVRRCHAPTRRFFLVRKNGIRLDATLVASEGRSVRSSDLVRQIERLSSGPTGDACREHLSGLVQQGVTVIQAARRNKSGNNDSHRIFGD